MIAEIVSYLLVAAAVIGVGVWFVRDRGEDEPALGESRRELERRRRES